MRQAGRDYSWSKKEHWGLMGTFINLIVAIVSWVFTYVESDQITYYKYMQVITCQLYAKRADQNSS